MRTHPPGLSSSLRLILGAGVLLGLGFHHFSALYAKMLVCQQIHHAKSFEVRGFWFEASDRYSASSSVTRQRRHVCFRVCCDGDDGLHLRPVRQLCYSRVLQRGTSLALAPPRAPWSAPAGAGAGTRTNAAQGVQTGGCLGWFPQNI